MVNFAGVQIKVYLCGVFVKTTMKKSYFFLFFSFVPLLLSCSKKDTTSVTYDTTDATVRTFALAAQDSFPGLAAAVFTVDQRLDTGLIAPKDGDSLLYGTCLTKVVPRVTFNSRPSAAVYYVGDTSFIYTGYDTVDLTQRPVYLRVYAANRTDEKYYRIEAYAHQTDPDEYKADTLLTRIGQTDEPMHVLKRGNDFYAYMTDGYTVTMRVSGDAVSWSDAETVTGLPENAVLSQIVVDSVSLDFCYIADTSFYRSSDGVTWTGCKLPFADELFNIDATLFSFGNKIWFVATSGGKTYLAGFDTQTEITDWQQAVPETFPVNDMATVVFRSVSGFKTALVHGGFDREGRMIPNSWTLEESGGGFRLLCLNESRYAQPAIAGAALVSYADHVIRFGGMFPDGTLSGVYESDSEGLFFAAADTAHLPVPKGMSPRYRQSAIVQGEYIYLFGGQDHSRYYTDVCRVRLNSIGWSK